MNFDFFYDFVVADDVYSGSGGYEGYAVDFLMVEGTTFDFEQVFAAHTFAGYVDAYGYYLFFVSRDA